MKSLILFAALALSSAAFASDCGRVFGTPGFIATNVDKQAARDTVMFQCETYRLRTRKNGSCSDMGCQQTSAGFTCTSMLTVCQ